MADTKIEWATKVWNPTSGCSPVSAGCEHCYAARMARRLRGRCGYHKDDPFQVTAHHNKFNRPFEWKKSQRIFVNSMGDLFHEDVPFEWVDDLMITIAENFRHTFMVLTKRPVRMKEYFLSRCIDGVWFFPVGGPDCGLTYRGQYIPNLWLGVTVENQEQDWRIEYLLETPAAVRFVSVEPMLGPVDLLKDPRWFWAGSGLNWVIAGPETGSGARPMKNEWIRNLYAQCKDAGVPFFDKKNVLELNLQQFPEVAKQ
jgi:protein gp37